MGKINILDDKTINKIAAGEVIERPASIVKELVENAIDAKATAITVEIKEGGIKSIRITDNGSGISREDIPIAFLRHTTSKIKQAEDLFDIHSLGFRGEALASICAVSRVEMMTKTHDEFVGSRYVIEGGKEQTFDEIGCPEGTTLIISNLFFNTPARQKFLKSAQTEAGYIQDIVQKLALGNPHISFKLIINGQNKLFTAGNHQLIDCIMQIHGMDIAKNIIPIEVELPLLSISGFIGKPYISRGNRGFEHIYINHRFVKSRIFEKAIEDGYDTFLTINKFPYCVLNIQINSDKLDVNVHPSKLEVRIDQDVQVYESVKELIKNQLIQGNLIPKASIHEDMIPLAKEKWTSEKIPEPFEKKRMEEFKTMVNNRLESERAMRSTYEEKNDRAIIHQLHTNETLLQENNKISETSSTFQMEQPTQTQIDMPSHFSEVKPVAEQIELIPHLESKKILKRRIIGQLFKTYWLVELNQELYFIDQHAAHEKILYERMMADFSSNHFDSQQLLEPQVLRLTLIEANLLESQLAFFKQIGFDLEPFGQDAFILRGIPIHLKSTEPVQMFTDILDQFVAHQQTLGHSIWHEKLALAACKAAVKAHDQLSINEYQQLIEQLLELENPFTCPHGRPIIIAMSQYEIEKRFKRIQ